MSRGSLERSQLRDWLVTSALSTLSLMLVWSVSVLVSGREIGDAAARAAEASESKPRSFATGMLRRMRRRTFHHSALMNVASRDSGRRQAFRDSVIDQVSAYEAQIAEDSAAARAIARFSVEPADAAYADALADFLHTEQLYWANVSQRLRERRAWWVKDSVSSAPEVHAFILTLVTHERIIEEYSRVYSARVMEAERELAAHRSKRRLALTVLVCTLIALLWLVQYAFAPRPRGPA